MKILLSPAKQMRVSHDVYAKESTPRFLKQALQLTQRLAQMDYSQYKEVMKCSDRIARPMYESLSGFLAQEQTTPAILAYSGIQYQYMAPDVFTDRQIKYVQDHVRILSGVYGILRPLDAVSIYRLEMQAKLPDSLYDFWGSSLADTLEEPILNLASEEYAKCIRKYKPVIDVRFCQNEGGKLKEKGVYAKMARGRMVRFMAEEQILEIPNIRAFTDLNYHFSPEDSTETLYTFIQKK
ncbi:MAG: peroxide stress protein YaaA [Erysipelotrichaceae bacterium]|nr:peroxide stress protein YaaA [Erysipelotrichaceae bacterium]